MPEKTINARAENCSDLELIRACQKGDTEAFRGLYRRHQQRVRALLHHLCDPTTLDDLVQEVFLRAWKGLPKMRGSAKFSTWLYRIAWNVGADYRRQMAQNNHRIQQQGVWVESMEQTTTPWQQIHCQDLVRRGIAHLGEDRAVVVILHDLQDVSQAEIAEILRVPVGTVKSRLFHARAMLRQFFKQEGVTL
ncbi:MAG: sigma-70 family RNA polymerase sigma factor [Acaryochloridaceae cyanobacterium RU_4_10]|nr:sigma-70 family RNA polymerase sigma factor [Acaryochloridaceae cyanobacterium RU_4_10]